MHKFLTGALAVIGAILLSCTGAPDNVAGGGTIETTNGVCAIVYDHYGEPMAGAAVRLRPADFLTPLPATAKSTAIISADAHTDDSGRFLISGVKPGAYRIEVVTADAAVLFSCTVTADSFVDLGNDTLRPFASISGVIDSLQAGGYVQVRGLDRLVLIDSAGRFSIVVPQGGFDLRVVPDDASSPALEIANVQALSGDTTQISADPRWLHSRHLYINTTASGAGVDETVTWFPLLIRLDASTGLIPGAANFDFTQTRDSGQDIRFTKPDGSALPYEIEKWDPAAHQAAIWVRMDTIHGNNDRQFLIMQWGASPGRTPPSASSGPSVFDTTRGFTGVFHLDAILRDAARPAAMVATNGARDTSGVIGSGAYFSGTDSIAFPTVNQDTITISAWVFSDSSNPTDSPAAVQLPAYGIHFDFENVDTVRNSFSFWTDERGATANWRTPANTVSRQKWYHVAATYINTSTANTPILYINGVAQPVIQRNPPLFPGVSNAGIGRIGISESIHAWHGIIDEVRIMRTVVSAAWIQLSYENQRPGSGVVMFQTK